jgi:hypothetical protein
MGVIEQNEKKVCDTWASDVHFTQEFPKKGCESF